MDILSLIIVLVVLGLVLWLVQTYLPLPPPIKTVIVVVAVLAVIIWLLQLVVIGHIGLR